MIYGDEVNGKMMRTGEEGLTLLEIVFSMAVLSVVVLSFTNLFASAFGASVQTGRTSQAAAVAQEKLEVLGSRSYDELLLLGEELNGGVFPCPGGAASSIPADVSGIEGLRWYYSLTCDSFDFDGFLLQVLRLEVVVLDEGDRQLARFGSYVQEGL